MLQTFLIVALLTTAIVLLVAASRVRTESVEAEVLSAARRQQRTLRISAGVAFGATLVATAGATIYFQDPGEAYVQQAFGKRVGITVAEGPHLKAPWVVLHRYDIRDNLIEFLGEGVENYTGGDATGRRVDTTVANGAQVGVDITLRYSVEGSMVDKIFGDFGPQERLVQRAIFNPLRAAARDVPTTYPNVTALIADRTNLDDRIAELLQPAFSENGINIEEISIQELVFDETVRTTLNEVQAAANRIDEALNDQETARVEAQTRIIEAQGVAEANAILSGSLTEQILTQRYIDTLKQGTIYVVPEGSAPFISLN